MKKLIMAAAIVCVAVTSNAAAFTWGASNVYIPKASNPKKAESNINPQSGSYAEGLSIALSWIGKSGAEHFIGNYEVGEDGKATASLGSATTDKLPADMIAEMGTDYKPLFAYTATYVDADGTYVYNGSVEASQIIGNLDKSAVKATVNFKNPALGSWSFTPAAVPEPTSGLLLLLGIAGLALKRKKA